MTERESPRGELSREASLDSFRATAVSLPLFRN
jgi:hypothetical protein